MKLIADLSVVTSERYEIILSFDFRADYNMCISHTFHKLFHNLQV